MAIYGIESLSRQVKSTVSETDPSIKSSLKFLPENSLGQNTGREFVLDMVK